MRRRLCLGSPKPHLFLGGGVSPRLFFALRELLGVSGARLWSRQLTHLVFDCGQLGNPLRWRDRVPWNVVSVA